MNYLSIMHVSEYIWSKMFCWLALKLRGLTNTKRWKKMFGQLERNRYIYITWWSLLCTIAHIWKNATQRFHFISGLEQANKKIDFLCVIRDWLRFLMSQSRKVQKYADNKTLSCEQNERKRSVRSFLTEVVPTRLEYSIYHIEHKRRNNRCDMLVWSSNNGAICQPGFASNSVFCYQYILPSCEMHTLPVNGAHCTQGLLLGLSLMLK